MLLERNRQGGAAPRQLTSYSQLMAQAELRQRRLSVGHGGTHTQRMTNGRDTADEEEDITLMKGVLWYCRDTLLSRWNWKERYFILTDDYLSCFKKAKGPYSDLGAFLFKLPLASLTGVEWQRLRGQAAVALCDPQQGRLLIRAPQDVLDQWYKALRRAADCSRERRRCLRLSSSNLATAGCPAASSSGARTAHAMSDSSPAIDRLCERAEREVWGGGGGLGSAGRLMRRQKSELDAGSVLRRQMHYSSQKRLNRHSMMPDIDVYEPIQRSDNDVIRRSQILRRHNDSLDSTGHSASTTPSKSSVSSSEGATMQFRDGGVGGASGSRASGLEGSTEQQRIISSVRRRSRGQLAHLEQARPQSMIYDAPSYPTEVVLRTKDRSGQLRHEQRAQHRRSCDAALLNRRTAYLAQFGH